MGNLPSIDQPEETLIDAEYAEELLSKGLIQPSKEVLNKIQRGGTISLPTILLNSIMNPQRESGDWIPVIEAVHFLSPLLGGDAAAKSAISERLRDGAVRCCCIWMAEELNNGRIPDRRPKQAMWKPPVSNGKGVAVVGGAFWTYSDDWDRDVKRWNWRDGVFVAVHGEGPSATRMVVKGLRVDSADIQRIITPHSELSAGSSLLSSEPAYKAHKAKRGRKRDQSWPNWVAELVVAALEQRLSYDDGAQEIYDLIQDRLITRKVAAPTFDAVETTISAVRARWQEAKVKGEIE